MSGEGMSCEGGLWLVGPLKGNECLSFWSTVGGQLEAGAKSLLDLVHVMLMERGFKSRFGGMKAFTV